MDQHRPWAHEVASAIGARVARLRGKRSAQDIADRCANLGMPSISRVVITKLENGRRESVSVAEVMVLAAALRVPPVELLFDVRSGGDVEVLPGVKLSQWEAVLWFAGKYDHVPAAERSPHLTTPGESDTALMERHYGAAAECESLEKAAIETAAVAREAGAGPMTEAGARAAYRRDAADRAEKLLAEIRAEMRRRGFQLPALSPGLAHVDAIPRPGEVPPHGQH